MTRRQVRLPQARKKSWPRHLFLSCLSFRIDDLMLDDRLFSRTDDRDLSSDVCLADHLAHDLGQWIIACLHQIHDLDLGRIHAIGHAHAGDERDLMRQTICDAITYALSQSIDSINDKIDWLTEDLHICFFVIKALMASDLDIAAICVDARFHYRGLGLAYRIKLRHDLTIQVAGATVSPSTRISFPMPLRASASAQ